MISNSSRLGCKAVSHVSLFAKGDHLALISIHSCPHEDHPHVVGFRKSDSVPALGVVDYNASHQGTLRAYRARLLECSHGGWVIQWQGKPGWG